MRLHLAGLTSLLGIGLAASAGPINIVSNPGFEMGTAGWTTNPSAPNPWLISTVVNSVPTNSGLEYAYQGCSGAACIAQDPDPGGNWLYQDLATDVGTQYTVSFFYLLPEVPGAELEVLFGSAVAVDVVTQLGTYQNIVSVPVTATSTLTRLEFLGRQDSGFAFLDDISVTATSASTVPEPSTFLLLGGGLTLLARWRRLRWCCSAN